MQHSVASNHLSGVQNDLECLVAVVMVVATAAAAMVQATKSTDLAAWTKGLTMRRVRLK